jgi:ABC-type transporter Mla subunit MlaD
MPPTPPGILRTIADNFLFVVQQRLEVIHEQTIATHAVVRGLRTEEIVAALQSITTTQQRMEQRLMALSDQLRELDTALADLDAQTTNHATEVDSLLTRVEARLAELGEPDPDLTNQLNAVRASAQRMSDSAAQIRNTAPAPTDAGGGGDTGGGDTGGGGGDTPPPVEEPPPPPAEEPPPPPAEEPPAPDTPPADDGGGTTA